LEDVDIFSKNPQVLIFIKIGPVAAELSRADGQKDITKLIVTFRNFAKALKFLDNHIGTG